MEVKENLIPFQVLWKGNSERFADTLKTKEAIVEWLTNKPLEISLELCGASKDGPISLVFMSHYSEGEISKKLFLIHFRELIKLFRKNTEVERLWLKWNDTTDDIIWTDEEAKVELNRNSYEKGDYILIHQ